MELGLLKSEKSGSTTRCRIRRASADPFAFTSQADQLLLVIVQDIAFSKPGYKLCFQGL
jgi:hypothetical protein